MELNTDNWNFGGIGKKLSRSNLVALMIGALGVMLLWYLAGLGDDEDAGWFAQYIADLAQFGIQAIGFSFLALFLVFLTNLIRNLEWFDRHGPGVELDRVRDRVGTPDERPGDNTSCAMQWVSGTILIAVLYLSFFMVIGK